MKNEGISASVKSCILILVAFMFLSSGIRAQVINGVISNNGAAIIVTSNTVVNSKDAGNITGGTIANDGTVNLTGDYTSSAFTSGIGLFRIGGNWVNSGTLSGVNTVNFNGALDQIIQRAGGENFYNLTISNTGSSAGKWVIMPNNVRVDGILTLSNGNIDATGFKLFLFNPAASALNYTSSTRSRILGKFERGLDQQGTYLFPLGTPLYYNPANLTTNTTPATGTIISEFITDPPGNSGMPFPDPPDEVFRTYTEAFWRFTSNGFSSNNISINLTANGFTDTIFDITRVVKRTGTGNWIADGTHVNASSPIVFRNNLTGDISALGTDFALARVRPLIITHPLSQVVCEQTDPVLSVEATGTGPLTYIWYKDGIAITAGLPKYSGHRSNTLTIYNAEQSDEGTYHCVVRDRDRNKTTSNPATLIVNEIPVATITNGLQAHECSDVAFENMVLNISYGVPGTTFFWSRTNTSAVTSSVPLTGTAMTIGDALSGSFTNITDSPVEIVFTITPVGPAATNCEGLPIEARVTINPKPRLIAENMTPETCYNGLTEVKLTSPSVMTMGTIKFDYDISIAATPAVVAGNRALASNVDLNSVLSFRYTNESDVMQSVYFNVTPKVVGLSCPVGVVGHPEVKVHAKPLQNLIIETPLTCDGGSNASLRAFTSLDAGAYYYDWIRTSVDQIHEYNIPYITGKKGGRWDLTVTDNLGCKSSDYEYVAGAFLDSYLYVVDTTGYGTTCIGSNDGQIWIKENNSTTGIPPFEYWIVRNSQDTVIHNVLNVTELLHKYDHLLPGNYKLLIRDNNLCYNTPSPEATIIEPNVITPVFDVYEYQGGHNVSCKDYQDGSVVIRSITGGNGGYTYKWHTVNGVITGPDNLNRLNNISAGTYYLTTTDRKGCTKLDSVILIQPAGMELSDFELSDISCNGGGDGSVNLNITGGSGSYIFSWSGPGPYSATTKNISGLKAGTYTVRVTDQSNSSCSIFPDPAYTLTEPPVLVASGIVSHANDGVNNIICNGGTGSIDITATGGTGGTYNYAWTTSDGSGIVDGAEDQNNLRAGTYTVVVSDSNNCSASVTLTLRQPESIVTRLNPKNISCVTGSFDNGSIELLISGGAIPYTYLWSNGAVTKNIAGLTAGMYSVRVTDFNGCITEDSARINLPKPLNYTRITSDYRGFNISCNGLADGFIEVTVTSGTAPYRYTWSGPNGFSSSAKDISALIAGYYNLMIKDSNDCTVTETITLTEPGKFGIGVSLSAVGGGYNINCAGESSGTIDIEPLNHVGSVEYLWENGMNGKSLANQPAGEYKVIIIDENNCLTDSTIVLTAPEPIEVNFDVTEPFCPDKTNGEIRISVTGGVRAGDYNYKWSDNSTTSNISDVKRGLYKVIVNDMNGCSVRDSVFVESKNKTCLIIPNAISPNDDLINDEWNIGEKELYPSMEVKIFNRWGEAIWRSEKGYPKPWDGSSNGSSLPIDSYHYIIDLHNGSRPIVGNVTILK